MGPVFRSIQYPGVRYLGVWYSDGYRTINVNFFSLLPKDSVDVEREVVFLYKLTQGDNGFSTVQKLA